MSVTLASVNNGKPRCIIVTGRPGSGKTTLASELAKRLRMPLISRDALKEGYVNTFGVRHDQLPASTNALVSDIFFAIVGQHLAGGVSVVIEAAFQHAVWEAGLARIQAAAEPIFVVCSLDGFVATRRHLQRALDDPLREFFHGDRQVAIYRQTRALPTPEDYSAPHFNAPSIEVSTAAEYVPTIDEIVKRIQLR